MHFQIFQQFLLFFCLLLHFSNAYFWSKVEENAFVAFVKGPSYFDQFCTEKGVTDWHNKNLLAHIYGTHLGVLHYIKLSLRCANDRKKFEEFFGTAKCEQFREYFEMFNILYEYLANIHAGHEVKMPIYKAKYFSIMTLVQAVKSLTHKAKLFFCDLNSFGENGQISEEEVNENPFRIHLKSEQNLDYYLDVTITAENREKFEKFMEEMMKKTMEKVGEHKQMKNGGKFGIGNSSAPSQCSSLAPPEDAVQFYDFILDMPLYDIEQAIKDEALFDLLRGKANIDNFMFNILAESPQFTSFYENKKSEFIESFEIYLGLLFLMKKNWHCANAKIKIENECERFRQYVDILYEYLLRMRYGITAVKPMFKLTVWKKPRFRNTIEVIRGLNSFSFSYFVGLEELERLKERSKILNLTNEKELNYSTISDLKRNKFDKEMEAIYEKCIEIASEKKAELCELKKEINETELNIWNHRTKEKTKEKRKEKRIKYEEKFELMIDSPFTNNLFDLEES